jgi:hypothetical protein
MSRVSVPVFRESPYGGEHHISVELRMSSTGRKPRSLPEYVRWLRTEFDRECPGRIHEQGTEPESALGSPRLAGAFRSYLMGSPMATDHDDRLDVDERGAARLFPVRAALAQMERRWPLSARFLFAVAWTGSEWQDVALAWRLLPEIGHRFALDALRQLWALWARDLCDTTREVA